MKKRYDIIYSIGQNCACGVYLQENKLRICSGPFDWVYGSGLKERTTQIRNDFSEYLGLDFLERKPTPFPEHDCYFDTRSKIFFIHDFPPNVPPNESFPAVKAKYERRIRRFYENIARAKRVLFVYLSIPEDAPETTLEDVRNAESVFAKKFGEGKVDLLVIAHDEASPPEAGLRTEALSPHTTFFTGNIKLSPPP